MVYTEKKLTNKHLIYIVLLILPIIAIFNSGCTDKLDLSVFDQNKGGSNITGDTVYIQLSPIWEGFSNPKDILVGHDVFIYVADTDNDRIVMLNLNGDVLGTRKISKPIAIAQDYQLNLIICAKFDTVLSGVNTTVSAVYKINMFAGNHDLASAPITRLLPAPGLGLSAQDLRVEYTSTCEFFDNAFLVGRKGDKNTSLANPDNSILLFQKKDGLSGGFKADTLIGRLPLFEPEGTGFKSAFKVSGLTSLPKRNIDFIMTLTGDIAFKSQWMTYIVSQLEEKYETKLSPYLGTPYVTPGRFNLPEDVTVDNAGNIFVVDAGKDSVFKFNSLGDEQHSFGGSKVFKNPSGIAYYDRVVYVADSGNNRILRFTLSTELR